MRLMDCADATHLERAGSSASFKGTPKWCHYVLLLGLVLVAVTYWAPWVDHSSAALRLSGQDMGEFVKFLPKISKRTLAFSRSLLYLPPFACAGCLLLLAMNRQLGYPRWLRVGMLLGAAGLLPGLLPPVWGHPVELFRGEFRLQVIALLIGLLLIVGHSLFRQISLDRLVLVVGGLAALGILSAQAVFWAIRPEVWAAYGTPTISLGWGLWVHIGAWATTTGVLTFVHVRRTRQRNRVSIGPA